jgi:hypothetical protein
MARAPKGRKSFYCLEAPPPDLRDLSHCCHPRLASETGGAADAEPRPGLAPESALRLHPCRALSSAPVSNIVSHWRRVVKVVVVVDREK